MVLAKTKVKVISLNCTARFIKHYRKWFIIATVWFNEMGVIWELGKLEVFSFAFKIFFLNNICKVYIDEWYG